MFCLSLDHKLIFPGSPDIHLMPLHAMILLSLHSLLYLLVTKYWTCVVHPPQNMACKYFNSSNDSRPFSTRSQAHSKYQSPWEWAISKYSCSPHLQGELRNIPRGTNITVGMTHPPDDQTVNVLCQWPPRFCDVRKVREPTLRTKRYSLPYAPAAYVRKLNEINVYCSNGDEMWLTITNYNIWGLASFSGLPRLQFWLLALHVLLASFPGSLMDKFNFSFRSGGAWERG